MSEKENFPLQNTSPALFEAAAFRNLEVIVELTGKLNMANRTKAVWPEETRKLYANGLNKAAEHFDTANLQEVEVNLLRAAKEANLDAPILRDRYAALAKLEFTNYKDPATLCQALGLRDDKVPMTTVNTRWAMMQQLMKLNNYCFDKNLVRGRICLLDDITGEITASFDKRRVIPLARFFEEYTIVADLSILHNILSTRQLPVHRTGDNLKERLEACLLHECALPSDVLRTILVPEFMTIPYYTAQILNEVQMAPKVEARPVEEQSAPKTQSASPRWDESRTVLELSERLKNVKNLLLPTPPDTGNILKIFQFAAAKPERAEQFANAFAYLDSLATANEEPWISDIAKTLSTNAVVWQQPELCVEVSDKLTGKLVYGWFHITEVAKGSQFLSQCVIKTPYRLWTQAEKVFTAAKKPDALKNAVITELSTGHASADLLFWLWRAKSADLKPVKDKYLGNADFLFKTLQRPVKGNYLKTQRDMKHLLTDDPDFQEQAMKYGNEDAVKEFVRCTKRLPLLNPGEKQSLLVKIATLYPQHIGLVEEKQTAPKFTPIGNITSVRSMRQREAELENLITVQIPENSAAIARAREMGDLRENSEFKFAKERQKLLNQRRIDWENELLKLTSTDFSNFKNTNFVEPGAVVTLTYEDDSDTLPKQETYCILGILDTDADKKIIAFNTPLGEALMHKEVNSKVKLPNGRSAVITKIEEMSTEMKAYVAGK